MKTSQMLCPNKLSAVVESFLATNNDIGSPLRTTASPENIREKAFRERGVDFDLPVIGDLGVFKGIMLNPELHVRAVAFGPQAIIRIDVDIYYDLNNGGRNGNDVVKLFINAHDYSLIEYKFPGLDVVQVAELPLAA